MRSARTTQISIVALVAGLAAFLFFNGKNNSTALVNSEVHANVDDEATKAMEHDGFNFELLEKDIKGKLSQSDADKIMQIESALSGRGKTLEYTLKLAEKYDSLNQPAIAGYYYQKVAEGKPGEEKYWALAGNQFFEAQGTVNDEKTLRYFLGLSRSAYEKALELNPGNLAAKIEQAVNIARSDDDPMNAMKGVGMLKEVEQVQPENRKMLFYLGALSIQSGQMEKAVERFEKLTQLPREKDDEMYPFYFRYLGDAYKSLGQNEKALEAFKEYRNQVKQLGDANLLREADQLVGSVQ